MWRFKHKNFRLLAIDPGIRGMGIAVFEGNKLIYHAVEMLEGNSTQEILRNGRKSILRLIVDFRPQTIVIEKPYFLNNKYSLLSNLARHIKKAANRTGIEFTEIAASTVKKFLTGNAQASKDEVCKAVLCQFPELKAYRTRERKWKARYHQNRFDAVAVGMTFLKI
jgi:Holliday junction resolvasome RuvABC endonuclease subunit